MVHPDLPDRMVNPVVMDNPVSPETTDNPAKDLLHNNNLNGASIAHLDPPAHPETTVNLATPVVPDNPELLEVAVEPDLPDPRAHPDPMETPDNLEAVDNPEDPVKCTKFPAQKDHPDLPVHPVNPEMMDNPAIPETPVVKDNLDPPAMLAAPANLVDPETPELPETTEKVVDMEDATIALPHVPLPDIKRTIQLSQDNYRQTIVLFSFIFCNDLYKKFRFMEKI